MTLTGPLVMTAYSTVNLKGGVYDFQGTYEIDKGDWTSGTGYENPGKRRENIRLTLDDGCVMTNLPKVTMNYSSAGKNVWTLQNASAVRA